jgi:hypothetical protein
MSSSWGISLSVEIHRGTTASSLKKTHPASQIFGVIVNFLTLLHSCHETSYQFQPVREEMPQLANMLSTVVNLLTIGHIDDYLLALSA